MWNFSYLLVLARKKPKISVLLLSIKSLFFKTSETILEANYGTRKHDYWTDSSYLELRSNSFNGKHFGKKQFLYLDTSASNTTELDPYKFTHFLLEVVRSMGSFGFQIWLERRSSRVSVFYFRSRTLQFGASVDVGREIFSLQARGSTNQWYTTVRS